MQPDALYNHLDEVTLIDVRDTQEWRRGHIEGSVNIPMSVLQDRIAQIPEDRAIVTVCDVGHSSAAAATLLREAGLDARNLWGGTEAWAREGLPLSATEATPADDQEEAARVDAEASNAVPPR